MGDGSPGSSEAEGEGGKGIYIAQSGRRPDLLAVPPPRKGMLSFASGLLTLNSG